MRAPALVARALDLGLAGLYRGVAGSGHAYAAIANAGAALTDAWADLNPQFETPVERLATYLARLDDEDDDPDDL